MNRALRITRLPLAELVSVPFGNGTLREQHPRLYGLLRQHLSAQIASTFSEAVPSADGQIVEFYSDLNGQPLPFLQASPVAQNRASQILGERLQAVQALANRFATEGKTEEAALLRAAAVMPDPRSVFLVGDHPVISNWGAEGQMPIAPRPVATVAPIAGAAAATSATSGRNPLWLLLPLLLLAFLAGLGWWWFNTSFQNSNPPPEPPAPPPPVAEEPKPQEPDLPVLEDNNALKEQIARLEAELATRLAACKPPEQPKLPEPEPEPKPEPIPELKPEPPIKLPDPVPLPEIPDLTPTPKPAPAKPAPVKPEPVKKPEKNIKKDCPESRQPWEAPEVVFLVDGSGSMEERSSSGQSRMNEAKSAVRNAVNTLPSDIDSGLLTFGDCGGIDNYNFFKPSERSKLLGHVDKLKPQNATPLARGMQRAGNMLNGSSVESVMVVVTDGEDTCGGDPCAVARALKAKKPKLVINVVDVGNGKAACIAKATGGKVFTPRSQVELNDMIKRATGQPTNCR